MKRAHDWGGLFPRNQFSLMSIGWLTRVSISRMENRYGQLMFGAAIFVLANLMLARRLTHRQNGKSPNLSKKIIKCVVVERFINTPYIFQLYFVDNVIHLAKLKCRYERRAITRAALKTHSNSTQAILLVLSAI